MTKITETLFLAGLIDEDGSAMASPFSPGSSHMRMTDPTAAEDHPLSGMADKVMAMRRIEGIMEKSGIDIDHLISWMQAKH